MSPVITVLQALLMEGLRRKSGSYRKVNDLLHKVFGDMIANGVGFMPEDFDNIYAAVNGSYWLRAEPSGWHRIACVHGNRSAAISYERHFGLKPWVWHRAPQPDALRRLYVGASINWDGTTVEITSIDDKRIIACEYASPTAHPRRPTKRHTITRAEFRQVVREVKAAKKAAKEAACG